MTVSHPDYRDGPCSGVIPDEGGDVEVRCELVALPRRGDVTGTVRSADGASVSASIAITGPESHTIQSDGSGGFSLSNLTPGMYTAQATADAFLIKSQTFEVIAREDVTVNIELVPRPARPTVQVRGQFLQIGRRINFATDSHEILPSSFGLMTEIADVLIRNAEITSLEIQGHTDNQGAAAHNMELSQQRADSVLRWLSEHGVSASRMTAQGYGMTRPLVPNITPANRARNRRVQFVIVERAE
jgi:outer membrane protein OmpA-like peptidoglycan-associated protein